jgi:hypothetical protein
VTRGRKQQREKKEGSKQLSKENGSTALRPAIGKKSKSVKEGGGKKLFKV